MYLLNLESFSVGDVSDQISYNERYPYRQGVYPVSYFLPFGSRLKIIFQAQSVPELPIFLHIYRLDGEVDRYQDYFIKPSQPLEIELPEGCFKFQFENADVGKAGVVDIIAFHPDEKQLDRIQEPISQVQYEHFKSPLGRIIRRQVKSIQVEPLSWSALFWKKEDKDDIEVKKNLDFVTKDWAAIFETRNHIANWMNQSVQIDEDDPHRVRADLSHAFILKKGQKVSLEFSCDNIFIQEFSMQVRIYFHLEGMPESFSDADIEDACKIVFEIPADGVYLLRFNFWSRENPDLKRTWFQICLRLEDSKKYDVPEVHPIYHEGESFFINGVLLKEAKPIDWENPLLPEKNPLQFMQVYQPKITFERSPDDTGFFVTTDVYFYWKSVFSDARGYDRHFFVGNPKYLEEDFAQVWEGPSAIMRDTDLARCFKISSDIELQKIAEKYKKK